MKTIVYVALALVVSCSFPAMNGRIVAKEENRCAERCIESVQKLESEFVRDFKPDDYIWRSDAKEAYKKMFSKVGEEYHWNLDDVRISKSKYKGKYANNYRNMQSFEDAYLEEKDGELLATAEHLVSSNTIPAAVIACINRIIPPKPDVERIKTDLAGHSISEGFEKRDCYFSEKWRRTFGEDVEIQEFHLDEITQDDGQEYSFLTSMVLKEEYLSYNARAQVYYVLPDGDDWKIDFVKSLGVRVIPTHKYDDCIQCEIDDDGWGGTYALFITNTSEVQLLVIGHIKTRYKDETLHFNQVITPGEKKQVGGIFGGGSVYAYEILIVERLS